MCLVGVVVRRYIDFLIILLIPTPLVSVLFCSSIPTFIQYSAPSEDTAKCNFVFTSFSRICDRPRGKGP